MEETKMKKIVPVILALMILLTACTGGVNEPSKPQAPDSVPEASAPAGFPDKKDSDTEPTSSAQGQDQNGYALTDEYVSGMPDYADLQVVFLGQMSEYLNLDGIIKRAVNHYSELSFINELKEERVIYGYCSEFYNNVYLIIPHSSVFVAVGDYNWYADGMTQVWMSEDNARPFIYVENGLDTNVVGIIEYLRDYGNGNEGDGYMFTGLNTVSSHLRTDYHMGIDDITDYTMFDSGELPFYLQAFMDELLSFEEIQSEVASGAVLNSMEEMVWDGDTYAVFSLSRDGEVKALYGVHSDFLTGDWKVIKNNADGEDLTWVQLARG